MIKAISFWVIVIIVFLVAASWLLLMVSGYRLNFSNFKIQKTGLIYIKSDPKDAQVILEGKVRCLKTPCRLTFLPGRYLLELKKDLYKTWLQTITVETEMAADAGSTKAPIILFLENPKIEEVKDFKFKTQEPIKFEDDWSIPKDAKNISKSENQNFILYQADDEIWQYDLLKKEPRLISRFSQPIYHLKYFSLPGYVSFIQNNEIKIMRTDGTWMTSLIKLTSGSPAENELYEWQNNGRDLIYQDKGKIFQATIR